MLIGQKKSSLPFSWGLQRDRIKVKPIGDFCNEPSLITKLTIFWIRERPVERPEN